MVALGLPIYPVNSCQNPISVNILSISFMISFLVSILRSISAIVSGNFHRRLISILIDCMSTSQIWPPSLRLEPGVWLKHGHPKRFVWRRSRPTDNVQTFVETNSTCVFYRILINIGPPGSKSEGSWPVIFDSDRCVEHLEV